MEELYKKQREIDKKYFATCKEENSLEYFGCALGGEVGELLNIIKKMARNRKKRIMLLGTPFYQIEATKLDQEYSSLLEKIKDESADIMIYLLILSDKLNFDLKEETLKKQEKNILRTEIHVTGDI